MRQFETAPHACPTVAEIFNEMGLFSWLKPQQTTKQAPPPGGGGKLPPRNTSVPGAAPVIKPAGLADAEFAGAAAEQLFQDLHETAQRFANPENIPYEERSASEARPGPHDRQYVSTLMRAVKNDGVELPALPDDVLRIQRLVSSPDCDVGELAKAIQRDPALSAKFIAVANSPIYLRGERVTTVAEAAVRVGLNQSTAIIMAVVSKAKMFRIGDSRAEADRLHQHALAAACAAKLLARGHADVERDAFIAGMLHDLGRVFMLSVAESQYRASRGEAAPNRAIVDRLADDLHAGFSALVAERWCFPAQVVSALQCHHLPATGGAELVILVPNAADRLTYTLAAADIVAHVVLGDAIGAERISALEGILAHLGVGAIDEVVAGAEEAYRALCSELS